MFKEQFPLLTNTTYLNTAYVGLMSTPLADFRRSHEEAYLLNGGDHYKIQAYKDLDKMHQNFASFFGSIQKMKSGLGEAPIYLGRYWNQI